jgi:hypothetical protein
MEHTVSMRIIIDNPTYESASCDNNTFSSSSECLMLSEFNLHLCRAMCVLSSRISLTLRS